MAVNCAEKTYQYMEFPLQISRQDSFPLDRSSIKFSYEDAVEYAKNDPIAYVGQPIAVIVNGVATLYVIKDESGTLKNLESGASGTCETMTGATADTDGVGGLVPAPTAGSQNMFLAGDGTYKDPLDEFEEASNEDIESLFNPSPVTE